MLIDYFRGTAAMTLETIVLLAAPMTPRRTVRQIEASKTLSVETAEVSSLKSFNLKPKTETLLP